MRHIAQRSRNGEDTNAFASIAGTGAFPDDTVGLWRDHRLRRSTFWCGRYRRRKLRRPGGGVNPGFGVGVGNEFGTGVGLCAKAVEQTIDVPRTAPQIMVSLIDLTRSILFYSFSSANSELVAATKILQKAIKSSPLGLLYHHEEGPQIRLVKNFPRLTA